MNGKELLKLLRSMKVGLLLLGVLSIISVFGSIIPQGRDPMFYYSTYSNRNAELIFLFGLDDVYHSFYFILLFAALAINLSLCSVTRLGQSIKRMKQVPNVEELEEIETVKIKQDEDTSQSVLNLFKRFGFDEFNIVEKKNEKIHYINKNNYRYLGSWLTHLGLLLVIVFYAYGQYTYTSTAVYGVPGTEQTVEGTDYTAVIHDFTVNYRPDGSVQQYITQMELLDPDRNTIVESEVSVNHPLRYDGYKFYQNSTGWAADFSLWKADELIDSDVFYESTAIVSNEENLAIQFTRFFPDFVNTERGPMNRSHELNNPKVLYSIFYNGNRVGMNVADMGEMIQWNEFQFQFDEPRMYTYLQVNKMGGKIGAAIGSLSMMLGLFMSFYIRPKALLIAETKNKLTVYTSDNLEEKMRLKKPTIITDHRSMDM